MFFSEINTAAEQESISEIATPKTYGNPDQNFATFGQTNLSFIEIVSGQVSRSPQKGVAENLLAVKIQPEPFSEDKKLYGQPVDSEITPALEIYEAIRAEIGQYGWDTEIALKVFYGESGLQEKIISKTSDVGVAQINLAAHWDKIPGNTRKEKILWLQDYKNNILMAWIVYQDAGNSWTPWVYYNNNIDNF